MPNFNQKVRVDWKPSRKRHKYSDEELLELMSIAFGPYEYVTPFILFAQKYQRTVDGVIARWYHERALRKGTEKAQLMALDKADKTPIPDIDSFADYIGESIQVLDAKSARILTRLALYEDKLEVVIKQLDTLVAMWADKPSSNLEPEPEVITASAVVYPVDPFKKYRIRDDDFIDGVVEAYNEITEGKSGKTIQEIREEL